MQALGSQFAINDGCSSLQSCDHFLQPSQPASHKQSQLGKGSKEGHLKLMLFLLRSPAKEYKVPRILYSALCTHAHSSHPQPRHALPCHSHVSTKLLANCLGLAGSFTIGNWQNVLRRSSFNDSQIFTKMAAGTTGFAIKGCSHIIMCVIIALLSGGNSIPSYHH